MTQPSISITRLPYDDPNWHVQVTASNSGSVAIQDFYIQPGQFEEFGRSLAVFGARRDDEARFEVGSLTGNWAYYVRLEAFIHDAAGHAALEIHFDNRRVRPFGARTNFCIESDVAGLNRLGEMIGRWMQDPTESLRWSTSVS